MNTQFRQMLKTECEFQKWNSYAYVEGTGNHTGLCMADVLGFEDIIYIGADASTMLLIAKVKVDSSWQQFQDEMVEKWGSKLWE